MNNYATVIIFPDYNNNMFVDLYKEIITFNKKKCHYNPACSDLLEIKKSHFFH